MDGRQKSHPLLISLLVLVALAVPAAAIAVIVPSVRCPHCLGEGLVEEPSSPGHWIRESDLIPRVCDCCGNRFKISKLKLWRSKGRSRPQPPVFTKGARSTFGEVQADRIRALYEQATEGVNGDPPNGSSARSDLVPVLKEALQDGNPDIQMEAAAALARMNRKDIFPLLVVEVRKQGAQPPNALVEGIRWLAREPDLRPVAVEVLTELSERRPDLPSDVRFHAAAALLDMEEPCSSDIFVLYLDASDEYSRIAAHGIVRYDRKDAISRLIKSMAGRPAAYVESLTGALSKLTGQNFGKDQTAWERWFEKNKDRFPPQIE